MQPVGSSIAGKGGIVLEDTGASLLRRRVSELTSYHSDDKNNGIPTEIAKEMDADQEVGTFWDRLLKGGTSIPDLPCMAEIESFSVSLLFDFAGPIGLLNDNDLGELEGVLKDAYNSVAGCDQPNAFIAVDKVTIDIDVVDSVGENIASGNEDDQVAFTWFVTFEGTCRGCSAGTANPPLFDENNTGECSCEFPTVEAFTVECNKRLAEYPVGVGGQSFLKLNRVTPMVQRGGNASIIGFGSTIIIEGSGGLFASGDFSLLGRYIMYNYNALSFLNYKNCDPEERIITSVNVVPDSIVQNDDTDENDQPIFSVIFNIIGSCRDCGQTTVIFGSHEVGDAGNTGATCPSGATITCPTEGEFLQGLQDLLESSGTSVVTAEQPPCDSNCDDGNLCTIDTCDINANVCSNEPIQCGTDEVCDTSSGTCESIQNLVPCVAVIDEWDNRNYANQWATFRSDYPKRPFCLLVPNSGVQTQ